MEAWQSVLIALYGIVGLIGSITGYHRSRYKKGSYGLTPPLYHLYTAYVWADMVLFGLFWFFISLLCLFLQDLILFLLILSLFWVVRSIGETQYWFHQQFTPNTGNPPEKFWHYSIFKNDSVWFVNQIFWQCITVISLVATLYFGYLWVTQL